MSEITTGDGYAVGHIDDMGDQYGFRKVRRSLDVTEFGVNAIVLPPGYDAGRHFHDDQQEIYFVHSGTAEMTFEDGTKHQLGPGSVARVDAATVRGYANVGEDDLVLFIAGGKGGYVGRDGRLPEGEERGGGPLH